MEAVTCTTRRVIDPMLVSIPTRSNMPDTTTLEHEGATYVLAEDQRGKKVAQVAKIIQELQENPGVPIEFEGLCNRAGQKYPQDVQAAVIALEMTEFVDRYTRADENGRKAKTFYVWVGPENPTPASASE